jgi:hypothetical protein
MGIWGRFELFIRVISIYVCSYFLILYIYNYLIGHSNAVLILY